MYPIAAGDCITGAGLLAGINMALCHRAKTGEGQHVTTSLMHTGLFCISHALATTAPVDTPVYRTAADVARRPCSTSYRTRDVQRVVILGDGAEAATLGALAAAFPKSPLSELKQRVETNEHEEERVTDSEWIAALEECFEQYTLREVLPKLEQLGVPTVSNQVYQNDSTSW